nr:unnamed protein product [Callosobruchus chinensis]
MFCVMSAIAQIAGPDLSQGFRIPFLRLRYLVDDPGVCPAKTLLMYLEKTRSLRQRENQLIITIKNPHHKASTQTISSWIKVMLRKS